MHEKRMYSTDILSVEVALNGETVVVRATGDLDMSSQPALKEALQQAGRSGRRVLLDLSELRFIDATGLSLLIASNSELGERMYLQLASPQVKHLLSLAGLGGHFPVDGRADS